MFVTHDIDEALRLADQVAVFGSGGVLQQYDEPARLLSRPANDFVARFIGLGRGYRWLQLLDAAGLPLHDIEQIPADGLADAQLPDGWVLVVDDGSAIGWIDADGLRRHRGGEPLSETMTSIGSVFHVDGNLSQALDAALSSPSTVGVAVDRADKVVGGILATDVLARGRRPTAGLMHYLMTHLDTAWALTLIHLRLSLVPVVIGLAIAVPLGLLVQRAPMLRRLTTATASLVFTIPSLALFVVLPLIIGTRILDEANVIVALTAYTTALMVRAVLEALDAVPTQVRDAAIAIGYAPITRMLKVELPLSIPVLVAGLRVVVVTNIAMVAVGSVIGIGGLGTWFTAGFQTNKSDQIVAGIIAMFALAVVIDTLISVAGRLATPWERAARSRRSIRSPLVGGAR